MLTLTTVIYGKNPSYLIELFGSVLSILALRESVDTQVVVYTDQPLEGFSLPVTQRIIPADDWATWTQGSRLTHLVKLHLIRRTVEEFQHPVIYFDTDTLFLVPPEKLAASISTNSALMHANEGPIHRHEIWANICDWLGDDREVCGVRLSRNSVMYNSGIVGVAPEHVPALETSVSIANALSKIDPIFSLDQFSTGSALTKTAAVGTCESQVFHYWGWRRAFVRASIEKFMHRHSESQLAVLCEHFNPAELARVPAIHMTDRIRAKLVAALRRLNPQARFAYLALLSARRLEDSDPMLADLWIAVHRKFSGAQEAPP